VLLKEFEGGFLKLVGANAAAGLRGDPIAVLLLDEVDGYPDDVDGEGDPVELATRRTDTFANAKIVKVSTPGKPRGFSRIESDYLRSDQRRPFVACPLCGYRQVLWWRDPDTGVHRLQWEKDSDGNPIASTVRYICAACNEGIDEKYKRRMLAGLQWVPKYPERRSVVGFYINALYSPWRLIWPELAQEWTDARDNPEKLKAFVTLRLAETWDEQGQSVDAHVLSPRRRGYSAEVPNGVGVLVATADTQHNRIEAQVVGFGAGEEQWLIAHEVFWGDPSVQTDPSTGANVWAQLDQFLLREWRHESGVKLRPVLTLIDSGNNADAVYDFVLPRQFSNRLVFACKGVEYLSKPGLVQEGTTKRAHVRLWLVATSVTKDRLFARLKIPAPGPGYFHLPDWTSDEYLLQLTSEKKIAERDKRTRRTKYHWVRSYARNEALDMMVYSHGALFILQHYVEPGKYMDLGRLADRLTYGDDPYKVCNTERRVRPLVLS
jgi:phage terminase large subunit GpA-like protein